MGIKHCQYRGGCEHAAIPTERYCLPHRRAMIREMEQAGYLQPIPSASESRGRSAREDVAETKYGPDA